MIVKDDYQITMTLRGSSKSKQDEVQRTDGIKKRSNDNSTFEQPNKYCRVVSSIPLD